MLDLPLRGGESAPDRTPAPPAGAPIDPPADAPLDPPTSSAPPPKRPTRPRRRRSRPAKKRSWPLFLILFLVVAIGGFALYRLSTPVAGFSTEALAFGEQLVGGVTDPLDLTISNTSSREMTIQGVRFSGDAANDFEVVGDGCSGTPRATGESCAVAVQFRPTANGERSATLQLAGAVQGSLAVSGTGAAPVLVVERSEIDFGPQPVDGRSASRSLELLNEGAAPLAVGSIELSGTHPDDFETDSSCANSELAAEGQCAVRIRFTPRAAGERSATLLISGDSSGLTTSVALRGVGVWSGEPLVAEPTEIAFGSQRRGRASDSRSFAFINRTSEPIAVSDALLDATSSGIEIADNSCSGTTLLAGEQCEIDVQFTPVEVGGTSANLAVTTATGLDTSVAISGTGVEPLLTVEKRQLEFGELKVGFERRRSAVLSNTGTDKVAFGEASLAGNARASYSKAKDGCSGFTLEPGRTCSIELVFRPAASGDQEAELRVESDAAGGRETVELRGLGTLAELTVDRQRLDFGSVRRPGTADRTLSLRNEGSARLQIQRVSVSGSAAADFVVSAIGCGESGLAGGASCRITVRFAPRADGARAARLVIQHDGDGPAKEVALIGTALAAQPGFRTSTESLDFSTRQVGSRSSIRTLTITNSGDGRLEISRIWVDGSHAREYTLVAGTCDGAPYVAPGGNCTVGVRFTPAGNGARSATLRVRHNAGGEGSIRLVGAGSGG